jgi:hypothetical protein
MGPSRLSAVQPHILGYVTHILATVLSRIQLHIYINMHPQIPGDCPLNLVAASLET